MIRRDTTDSAGRPAWLLITQPQHAVLAANLASAWNLHELPPELHAELIWTLAHHDDGWYQWDGQPRLDEDGRPIDFREMSVDDSNRIWTRSIKDARRHGPLAGYLVASHFLALRSAGSSVDHPDAVRFAATYEPRSRLDLQTARRQWGDVLTDEVAVRLHEYVSRFDLLSLMLCCQSLDEGTEFDLAAGWGFRGQALVANRLTVDPWPLRHATLELAVLAQRVPAVRYRDAQELKQAVALHQLTWTFEGR